MDIQSFFSKTVSNNSKSSISFSDSFLRFASFAEKDNSIYPYWRVFEEKDKFMFIDRMLINAEHMNYKYLAGEPGGLFWSDIIDYVIDKNKFFWSYMLENSEFLELDKTTYNYDFYWSLRDHRIYYIPNFTIRSIALFADLNLSYKLDRVRGDEFIVKVSRCRQAKNYFESVFNRIKSQIGDSDSLFVAGILGIVKPYHLNHIKQSILDKIDELITA